MTRPLKTCFKVGRKYRVFMSVDLDVLQRSKNDFNLATRWHPHKPRKRLHPPEIEDYRRGRNAFFAEITRLTGLKALLVETDSMADAKATSEAVSDLVPTRTILDHVDNKTDF